MFVSLYLNWYFLENVVFYKRLGIMQTHTPFRTEKEDKDDDYILEKT